MLDNTKRSQVNDKMNERPMGTHGAVWCVIAGSCYGLMQIFSKQAYENGLTVAYFLLIRHVCLLGMSYTTGKFFMGVNFDPRQYTCDQLKIPIVQAFLALGAKIMSYASIYMIPLTIYSCVYFTTAPIFAALLGLMCICEKLTLRELMTIAISLIGTLMVTMPQWFLFLGIDKDNEAKILNRLEKDQEKYGGQVLYYTGIILVASSVFIDSATNFAIRFMGATQDVPKSFIPFFQGGINAAFSVVYIGFFEPDSFRQIQPIGFIFAFVAGFFSWLAQESLILGVQVSKSALGTYGFQSGILVPIIFDAAIARTREMMWTDGIGVFIILLMQIFNILVSVCCVEPKVEDESSESDEEHPVQSNIAKEEVKKNMQIQSLNQIGTVQQEELGPEPTKQELNIEITQIMR